MSHTLVGVALEEMLDYYGIYIYLPNVQHSCGQNQICFQSWLDCGASHEPLLHPWFLVIAGFDYSLHVLVMVLPQVVFLLGAPLGILLELVKFLQVVLLHGFVHHFLQVLVLFVEIDMILRF